MGLLTQGQAVESFLLCLPLLVALRGSWDLVTRVISTLTRVISNYTICIVRLLIPQAVKSVRYLEVNGSYYRSTVVILL